MHGDDLLDPALFLKYPPNKVVRFIHTNILVDSSDHDGVLLNETIYVLVLCWELKFSHFSRESDYNRKVGEGSVEEG